MAQPAFAALQSRVGRTLFSNWLLVDQAMIDAFADATGDRQFIHVDPQAAAATPFGGTVAHGFLLLSLMPKLSEEAEMSDAAGEPVPSIKMPSIKMGVNYGGNKTRFIAPVRSGSKVRGAFTTTLVEEKRPGQIQMTTDYVLEIEGGDKPALTAEWITQIFV